MNLFEMPYLWAFQRIKINPLGFCRAHPQRIELRVAVLETARLPQPRMCFDHQQYFKDRFGGL